MFGKIASLDEVEVGGKRVFCRLDLNVPLSEGKVRDDTRIQAALPTLRYLLEHGARVVAASHLGRPKGKVVPELSLEPVAARLAELLDMEVFFSHDTVGDGPRKLAADLKPGQMALLENLRFHPGETKNDPAFAKELSSLADLYVNDAFGTAHRAHASTVGMVAHVSEKAAGRLMFKELEFFSKLLVDPARPFVAILGGAKVSDKIGVLRNLLGLVDEMLIGGAMANTFLAAQGHDIGASLVERDKLAVAREILAAAEARNVKLVLPEDVVVAESPQAPDGQVVAVGHLGGADMALDVGPKTLESFRAVVAEAASIFWNGPMGVFEQPAFARGTVELAKAVAASKALSVVGGGDSVAAVNQAGVADGISHISTGGGASLELMEGKRLPGLVALELEAPRG